MAFVAGNRLTRTVYESVQSSRNFGDACQRGGNHIVGAPMSEQENLRIISDCSNREASKSVW